MNNKVRFGILKTELENIEYQIIFSKRKSVGICVYAEKGVIVRVPKYMTIKAVEEVIREKEGWIVKAYSEIKAKIEEKPVRNFVDGENVLYLGKIYSLKIQMDPSIKKSKVILTNDRAEVIISNKKNEIESEIIKKVLVSWYKEQATIYAEKRAAYYAMDCKEIPSKIVVKEQKRRWGSCSSDRVIRINWRCIMAPEEVFDYVIVHEMCHLKHMNHGTDFWNMVESVMPDYKEKRLWLKQHGHSLDL